MSTPTAKRRKPARQLTGKQRAFIEAYFACNFNATEAARRAGYAGDYNTLAVCAFDNLKKPIIRAEIERRFKQVKMGADEVLARLSFIASGSMEDFVDPDSVSIDLKKAALAKKLGLLKKLKVTTVTTSHADRDTQTETVEFELHDPMRAMEMLGKHWRVFERAGESDWKQELIAAGLDPDKFTDELAQQFREHMLSGAKVKDESE